VKGFTLLELMVALVIVAIVASVAYPSFMSSIRKGRRSDASDAAAGVMQAQERWRANNAQYSANFTNLNVGSTTANGYYTMALSAVSGTAYTITFTPVAAKGQNNDTGCTAMSVTVTGTSPVYAPSTCWSR
jgi:type IV pilus assembly protein PilE